MLYRIMLVAALVAVPALMVAEPSHSTVITQHPDSAKTKKHSNKKSSHPDKNAKPAAPKAAPHDSGK